ncbi:MAG TPA: helix-turn-helix transcriptional regulator [Streptosporangiaceae bacterium]|nr:helix-turn-helix transcriptional regulator [Streptosporangiaceae bacterium]
MAGQGSPTVRRRRLAAELRDIRLSRGESGDIVAAALNWSPAKISRYELARTGLKPGEVERLLDYYEVAGPRRARLLALAEDAARKGWWEEYSDVITPDLVQLIGLEEEASSISIWQSDIVPGILQTESYARHVMSAYSQVEPTPPSVIERRVRVRTRRQEVITREPPPQLAVILDESALIRRVGDEPLMSEQLMHLAQVAELPNVTLRILPIAADHTLLLPSYSIFRFGPEADAMLPDVVRSEGLRNEFYEEGEINTYLHRRGFEVLLGASMEPAASLARILDTVQTHWQSAEEAP